MDRIDASASLQRRSHLLHTILPTIEHDDFNIGIQSREHVLVVRDSRINEGNLHARLCRHVIRQGLYDILTATVLPTRCLIRCLARYGGLCLFLSHLFSRHLRCRGRCRGVKHEPLLKRQKRVFECGRWRRYLSVLLSVRGRCFLLFTKTEHTYPLCYPRQWAISFIGKTK